MPKHIPSKQKRKMYNPVKEAETGQVFAGAS
jgi:hypothetical protein